MSGQNANEVISSNRGEIRIVCGNDLQKGPTEIEYTNTAETINIAVIAWLKLTVQPNRFLSQMMPF